MKVLTRISAHASVCAPARARLLGEGGGVRACGVSRIPGRDSMTEPDTNTEGAGARTAQGGRARSLLSDLTPRTVRLNCGGTRNGSAQSSTAEEPKTGFVPPPFRCARGSRRAELGGSPEFALRPQRRTGGAQPDGRTERPVRLRSESRTFLSSERVFDDAPGGFESLRDAVDFPASGTDPFSGLPVSSSSSSADQ